MSRFLTRELIGSDRFLRRVNTRALHRVTTSQPCNCIECSICPCPPLTAQLIISGTMLITDCVTSAGGTRYFSVAGSSDGTYDLEYAGNCAWRCVVPYPFGITTPYTDSLCTTPYGVSDVQSTYVELVAGFSGGSALYQWKQFGGGGGNGDSVNGSGYVDVLAFDCSPGASYDMLPNGPYDQLGVGTGRLVLGS